MPPNGSRLTRDTSVVALNESTSEDASLIAKQFTSVPEVMEFESWWSEGGQKRYMLLLYCPAKEVFEVMVDDSVIPMKVVVYNRRNKPLKPWNLHVGTVVDILGKSTTLMKAKQSTMQWIDSEARRLWDKKQKLEATLEKFRRIPDLTPLSGVTVKKLQEGKSGSLGGTVDLAKLAITIIYLQKEVKLFKDI